jgi:putative transposase
MFKEHRENEGLLWRVEPICEVLNKQYGIKVSSSGYYAFKKRKPSFRTREDERLKALILEIWEKNYSCWGVQKTWRELRRGGENVARCTVERLMRELEIRGLHRSRVKRTTIAGKHAKSADDLVGRNFCASTPNAIWVADFTYVSTWEGWCYTAFVTDVFARRILGWAVSARMNEDMVADAFKMAVWTRHREGNADFSNLIHHNDKGAQYTADGFFELLALHGIRASIGTVGDSYDNALAETMFGNYKCTLIHNPTKGPWKSLEQLETETARWVYWHNNSNITEYNNWNTPLEIEKMIYTTGEDGRKCSKKRKA